MCALFSAAPVASCSRAVPSFDGNAAYTYLVAQTDFGPRNPGSEGAARCREYLVAELSRLADRVAAQRFTFTDSRRDTTYELTNIIASFNLSPPKDRRIMLMAHWDTRPWADQDPDPENHGTPIIGANDGASGVAVLLQAARIMKEYPPPAGVDIVLFDGEDSGDEGSDTYWCAGSKYFAENRGAYNPAFGVLLDLVGDRDLRLPMEGHSLTYAQNLTRKIWDTAAELNLPAFVAETGPTIYDDHVPVNQAGIQAVDIIDFDYPYWHTLQDTPDKCSPESLRQVGTLILSLIYE